MFKKKEDTYAKRMWVMQIQKRDWDHSDGFYCGNEESENYGASTFYDDSCNEWEEKE